MQSFSEHGRWKGKLTRAPLPDDPSIAELSPETRKCIAENWHLRASMEFRVGESFKLVHGALVRKKAPQELVDLAERAVDDELRHTALSQHVAHAFAGKELPSPPVLPLVPPSHPGATAELRDTLWIVGQCVFNETTASAFLETSRRLATAPLARAALSELLSDEIDHGRIGWAHLGSLSPKERAEVAPWLLPMAFVNLKNWKKETPLSREPHDPVMTAHGLPPGELLHAAFVDALETLIVPGFAALEMNTVPLRRWLESGASTDQVPAS